MSKRLTDILLAATVLVCAAPLLLVAMLAIWLQDGDPPLYRAIRVGRGGRDFRMLKLRTMLRDAEQRGGTSTAKSDSRVTRLGHRLRRWKLDELPQFWNVLTGEMSVVGPRPNTRGGGVDRYTAEEMRLLSVRPGITDLASIVFSDEGDILDGAPDPDALYDAVIRPWKSQLGLLYVDRADAAADIRIIGLTALAIIAKPRALAGVDAILAHWDAAAELRRVCRRRTTLLRAEPPGVAA
jgi:lipopolysaccharide/colanic/teichoic acid biosynthesis glycosyltransferase